MLMLGSLFENLTDFTLQPIRRFNVDAQRRSLLQEAASVDLPLSIRHFQPLMRLNSPNGPDDLPFRPWTSRSFPNSTNMTEPYPRQACETRLPRRAVLNALTFATMAPNVVFCRGPARRLLCGSARGPSAATQCSSSLRYGLRREVPYSETFGPCCFGKLGICGNKNGR